MVNFKAPYNKEEAVSFLGQFLPDDFQKASEEIKVDFKSQFIRHIRKIGEVPSLENLHIYEIIHESENDPRVSLSKDSFRLLAHFNVRKALIFFVSQNSPNYRLSLVTVDLKWESGAKVKREYSNPRRYSFFLGPDARVHTPHDFLFKKGQAKNTTDLLSRFDVEIVTKEFFTKYKGLFGDVSGYLEKDHGFKIFAEKNDIDIDTFSKKLLGQIVFCYFLQRKGWLGAKRGEPVNKGDKDFMRSLFNRGIAEKKNFYNDYLEYLFYGSLNNRAEGSSDFYRKHFDCQIPFLNGGLFEPPENYDWEKSFVHIPDKLFSNNKNTGILDVFDLYNFTVYEDDPIDREVSVDPEMLGKVFENLLPENLRKGQGAYYTPREIVHYMCQESLINYLATETKVDTEKIRDLVVNKHFEREGSRESIDRALQNIKVCDPACGSGAFLVGMLHEIVSTRRILNPKADEYHLKKEAIQNCIYGVDIDPGAVEIAKLRLWLSLVVDYELKDIEPLPNLDYKIMCGNSLLEEFEGVRFYDGGADEASLFKDDRKQKIQELREKVKEYFKIYDEKEKRKKREEINKLKDWFIKATLEKRRKEITRERKKIEAKADMFQERNREEYFTTQGKIFVSEAKINEVLRELHNPQKARPFFIWKLEFMDVFEDKCGFDVVIANPPYVKKENLSSEAINQLEQSFYEIKSNKRKSWSDDLYVHFIFKGLDLVRENGTLTYITNDSFIGLSTKERVRTLMLENNLIKLIKCPRETFEAMIYTAVFILKKEISIQKKYESGEFIVPSYVYRKFGDVLYGAITSLPHNRLIMSSPILNIYSKLSNFPRVKEYFNILDTGIHTGNIRDKIFFKEKTRVSLERLLQGKQINRFGIFWDSEGSKYKYCDIHYVPKKIKGTGRKGKASKLDEYWHFCGNMENHHQPERLLMRQSDDDLIVAYHNEKEMGRFYTDNTLFTILPALKAKEEKVSLKYALAVLNSKLLNTLYHFLSQEEGKTLAQVKIGLVNELPFAVAGEKKESMVTVLVDKIIDLTKTKDFLSNADKQKNVQSLQQKIDACIYELYDLSAAEVTMITAQNDRD